MNITIEKVLSDAEMLVSRLQQHDSSADTLIAQAHALNHKVDGMKQYQDINNINERESAKHRPRSSLIHGLVQENKQIRDLQQENDDLKFSLEEHQTALELIMSKYREHIQLFMKQKQEKSLSSSPMENCEQIDKICEMATVMQRAIVMDDIDVAREQEQLTQLQIENRGLREMLKIKNVHNRDMCNISVQTDIVDSADTTSSSISDSSFSGSVIEVHRVADS